jgi:3-oxoacyl-[acyl-carrier protein] reductase
MKVVLVYLNSIEKAKTYLAELEREGREAVSVQADITTEAGIEAMTNKALSRFGGIDALVLDAAYNNPVRFDDLGALTPELWNKIIGFNLTSPYLAMRRIGPEMKQRGGGRIVTISSIAGFNSSGSNLAYCISKAGLIHLTHCMSVALAPSVLVNGIAPGLLEGSHMTDILPPEFAAKARQTSLTKEMVKRDDVADAVRLFIETDSITGQNLVVDGGRVFH